MSVDGRSAGIFQYDADTGRTLVELDPAFRGQGLGQRLILKGIYTAAMLGMNYVEDESRTQMFDRAMDRLVDAGYIVNDDEYWYVTSNGEQFLKQGVAEDSEQKNTNDLNEKWSQKYKRSIDCSHPKGFSQRAHCQGRKKNEDTLSEKKRRKAKAKRVYGGYAFYPIATVDSGEGGDGGGLEEGWKEKLAAAGAAGAMALGGYNYVKQPTQTTQQPQPTAQAQQKTIKPITQKPLEKILYTHAVKAGLSGDELAQFMAQCAHETNDWNSLVEYGGSLDFRKYDPKFAPKKAKILGNTKIGDGARYKGRGYIQLTGRYNYTKASKALGIDLVNKPELAQHPDTAAEIALLFWKNRVRPNVDDFQNTTQVTKKINSGLRGLEDRHENYQDYLRGSGNNKK
jgi:putative chitinase